MKIQLKGTVIDKKLTIKNEYFFRDLLSKFEGKEVVISVEDGNKSRSLKQNDWYWGIAIPAVIYQLKNHTGEKYSKDDIHDWNLSKVIGVKPVVKDLFEETIVIYKTKRTSQMSTKEFINFKETIQKYWAEKSIIIPDPSELNNDRLI